jgi:hypothetical protein
LPKGLEGVLKNILQSDPAGSFLETVVSDDNNHFEHYSWKYRQNVSRLTEIIARLCPLRMMIDPEHSAGTQ